MKLLSDILKHTHCQQETPKVTVVALETLMNNANLTKPIACPVSSLFQNKIQLA